jgi:2-C-methyl-D-erythritol 4-phosphate cytidylyltransferase
MGEDKLALSIDGVPVLARTLKALDECDAVGEIIVVTRMEKVQQVAQLCRQYSIMKVTKVLCGGETRTQSALAGVSETDKRAKVICIHDGARPFVTEAVVEKVIQAAKDYRAAAPAIPVKDTVRIVREDGTETPDRSLLFATQTPQAFDADLIKASLTAAVRDRKTYTDDCAAAEAMGFSVHLTEGDEDNIKITTPADIPLAEAIAANRKGTGK